VRFFIYIAFFVFALLLLSWASEEGKGGRVLSLRGRTRSGTVSVQSNRGKGGAENTQTQTHATDSIQKQGQQQESVFMGGDASVGRSVGRSMSIEEEERTTEQPPQRHGKDTEVKSPQRLSV
jgi:hypothetical protein